MKISESSWGKYAIVEGIECRMTKKTKHDMKDFVLNIVWYIDEDGIARTKDGQAILLKEKVAKVEKKMRALGYTEFDYDSKPYALVKCFKS